VKIVSWQSVLTEHQIHTFRALEKFVGEPIEFVLGVRELSERKRQGWTSVSLSGLSVHDLPARGWWSVGGEMLRRFPDALHLFNGLWGDRRFFPLLLRAQMAGVKTGLLTEPFADAHLSYFGGRRRWVDGLKAAIRPLAYRAAGRIVARRMTAVFAISSKAVAQFKAAGFGEDRIFPFGYFVPALADGGESCFLAKASTALQVVFVGSLIERKGLPTLFDALRSSLASGVDISLDVFGPGSPPASETAPQGVTFRGTVPFGQVQAVVRNYDLLVLPSLHDGWGVVVNEALLQGVPVIVSDAVGACTLVEKSGAGCVFMTGDANTLAQIFIELSKTPEILDRWRAAAMSFRGTLSPEVAADYLYRCLLNVSELPGSRPAAPWYA
jgi:glycosyltransferase involved in cell wall biosynthesis